MARRVAWRCPDCGRSFRVLAEQRATASCPKCSVREQDMEFAEAPASSRKSFSVSVTRSPSTGKSAESERHESRDSSSDAHRSESTARRLNAPAGDAARDDVILSRLDELTKSMRFFKRLVWCMIIATALNALIMGIGLVYSIQMLGTFGDVFSSAGEIDPQKIQNGEGLENLPPDLQKNLQAIQNYSDTLNELMDETRSN